MYLRIGLCLDRVFKEILKIEVLRVGPSPISLVSLEEIRTQMCTGTEDHEKMQREGGKPEAKRETSTP